MTRKINSLTRSDDDKRGSCLNVKKKMNLMTITTKKMTKTITEGRHSTATTKMSTTTTITVNVIILIELTTELKLRTKGPTINKH